MLVEDSRVNIHQVLLLYCLCRIKYAILSASVYPFLGSIVVSISACHAEDPGSIPGRGGMNFFSIIYHAIHHQLVV